MNMNNYLIGEKLIHSYSKKIHNLFNDKELRKSMHLPKTKIETDSYIAVQLIEKKRYLTGDSIKSSICNTSSKTKVIYLCINSGDII